MEPFTEYGRLLAEIREELNTAVAKVNRDISAENIEFQMSDHMLQQIILPRNKPRITVAEVERILRKTVQLHSDTIRSMRNNTEFTIRCTSSNIHIPSAFRKKREKNTIITITIMRKKDFFVKDDIILEV